MSPDCFAHSCSAPTFLTPIPSLHTLYFLPVPPTLLRVLRVARVLRILRLLKNLKGLRDLVFTLVLAFPGLINVGALLGLVMFMYAVLGMNVFTFVMHGDASKLTSPAPWDPTQWEPARPPMGPHPLARP